MDVGFSDKVGDTESLSVFEFVGAGRVRRVTGVKVDTSESVSRAPSP